MARRVLTAAQRKQRQQTAKRVVLVVVSVLGWLVFLAGLAMVLGLAEELGLLTLTPLLRAASVIPLALGAVAGAGCWHLAHPEPEKVAKVA